MENTTPKFLYKAYRLPKTNITSKELIWPDDHSDSYYELLTFLKINESLNLSDDNIENGWVIKDDKGERFVNYGIGRKIISKYHIPVCGECRTPLTHEIDKKEFLQSVETYSDGTKYIGEVELDWIDTTKPIYSCWRCPAISAMYKKSGEYAPINDY